MKCLEFFKWYYNVTMYDIASDDSKPANRHSYVSINKKNRRLRIIQDYMVFFWGPIVIGLIFYKYNWYYYYLVVVVMILCLNIKLYRFGLVYYFLSWILFDKRKNASKNIIEEYIQNPIGVEHLESMDGKYRYVLKRTSDRSVLKLKYQVFVKGKKENSLKLTLKLNSVILKKKFKKIKISCKKLTREEYIDRIISSIICLLEQNN